MGADDNTLSDISMDEVNETLIRLPASEADRLSFFITCINVQLELPEIGSMLNYTQQTMQRGFALAKTMIKKENGGQSTPWDGSSYGRLKVVRSGNAIPMEFRTEAQKEMNPIFIVGIDLPNDLASTDSCVIEIVAQFSNNTLDKVLCTTSPFDAQVLLDARMKGESLEMPLDAPDASIQIHWSRAMSHSLPLQFVRSDRKLYRWSDSIHMLEEVAEVPLCAQFPQQVLQQSISEFLRKKLLWQSMLERAALQECRFQDDATALASGCDVISVNVSRARGLQMSAAPPLVSSDSVTQALRSSMFALAKTVKTSAFSKLKSMGTNGSNSTATPTISTESSVNAYCELSYNDPKTFDSTWRIGKTNTILNNTEPIWEPESVVAKLQSTIDAKQFVFYRPPNLERRGYFEGQVLVDPAKSTSARSNRRNHISLGFARVELQQLKPTEDGGFEFHDWVRVHQREGDSDVVCRCDGLGTQCVGEIEIHMAIKLGNSDAYPQEFEPLPVVSGSDLPWLGGASTLQVQPMMYTTTFIEKQIASLNESISTLSKLTEVSTEWIESSKRFKSSQDKKTWSVQHIPTNLHVGWTQSASDVVLATVTCGIPASHALGLDKTDLAHMDEQTIECIKDVHTLQAPLSTQSKGFYGVLGLDNESYGAQEEATNEVPTPPQTPTPSSRLSSLYSTAKRNLPPALAFKSEDKSLLTQLTRALELQTSYHIRKTIVVAQALTATISAFQSNLELVLQQGHDSANAMFEQWKAIGFLCGWESLVSSHGKELHMLLDAYSAFDACRHFQFLLVRQSECNQVTLVQSTIQIPVDNAAFEKLPMEWKEGSGISISCVLFTQGINEMQSLANMSSHLGGNVSKQSEINTQNLIVLNKYHKQFKAMFPSNLSVEIAFNQLRDAVINENGANKNTDILHLASQVVRLLRGGRVTCCKSGKDRTAMSVTWEQAQWISKQSAEEKNALDMANIMREYGVRLDVAFKNVGNRKYSFNALQRKLLPAIYRPPLNTIQDIVTSVALRDS